MNFERLLVETNVEITVHTALDRDAVKYGLLTGERPVFCRKSK
jgi:hypothetical protein